MKEKLSLQKRSPKLTVVLAGEVSSLTGLQHFFDTKSQDEINRQILVVGKATELTGTCLFFSRCPIHYALLDVVVIRSCGLSLYATLWSNTPIPVMLKSHYPKSVGVAKAIADIVKRCTRMGEVVRVQGEINYCEAGDNTTRLNGEVKNWIIFYKRGIV